MPRYQLYADDEVSVRARPLHVSARDAGTGRAVRLQVEVDGVPDHTAVVLNPEVTVLPTVTRRVVLRVLPPSREAAFAEPTAVTVRLVGEVARGEPGDADDVVLAAVDVSGLASCELAEVSPDRAGVRVAALNAVADDPVGGVAARVRGEAREVLGVDGLPGPQRSDLLVGVDLSASMRPAVADGSVAALLDAVVGLSYVVGRPGRVRAGLLGRSPRWLSEGPGGELAGAVLAEVERAGPECGFRPSEADPPEPGGDRGAVLFLVTDAVPADAAALAAAGARDGVARHLLISGVPGAERAGPDGLSRTVLPPPPAGVPADEHLLGRSGAADLRSLVSSLVTRWSTGPVPAQGGPR